jgi:hypothetical protein
MSIPVRFRTSVGYPIGSIVSYIKTYQNNHPIIRNTIQDAVSIFRLQITECSLQNTDYKVQFKLYRVSTGRYMFLTILSSYYLKLLMKMTDRAICMVLH